MKEIISIVLVIMLTVFIVACSKQDYLFDKNSFQKDDFTYLDWKEYRGKMGIAYEFWNTPKIRNIWSDNQGEARFIFDQLKESKETGFKNYEDVSRYALVVIKRQEDGRNILVFDVNKNGVAKIGGSKYYKITDKLWNHLMEVEKREENIPLKLESDNNKDVSIEKK